MIVLVCEDSLTGILSGVYHAWADGYNRNDLKLQIGEAEEYELFAQYIHVESDEMLAEKVKRRIVNQFGKECYEKLYYASWSYWAEKGNAIYQTIRVGLEERYGHNLLGNLRNPYVHEIVKMHRNVWNEVHHYYGFVRFQELEDGSLFSKIEPKNYVLEPLAVHFANRFPGENWLIYDVGRRCAVVHKKYGAWYVIRNLYLEEDSEPDRSIEESSYETLWKEFLQTIEIKERHNLALQRTNMPLRFRKYMPD